MSTYWYLECTDHDPPLRSEDEVEQHTYGLPAIRDLVSKRQAVVAGIESGLTADGYFERHAVRFIVQHPKCKLQLASEYGDIEEI